MKNALIGFGKIILSLSLGFALVASHTATIQSWNIAGNLFFIGLFSWGIYRLIWGKLKKRKKYPKFKINHKTWKKDFEKILREENFTKEQIPNALQFAENFRAFESKFFEIAKKNGFEGEITEYDQNDPRWVRVFAKRMDMGLVAVEMRPKTLGFLASLRKQTL
jgi:hypothetical protein